MQRFLLAPLVAGMLTAGVAQAQSAHRHGHAGVIDTLAIRAHTRFLASDLLEGRGTGTRGERLAAEYIASQLERLQLRPVGDSYFQTVPLRRLAIDAATHLVVRRDSDSTRFHHGRDFIVGTGAADAFRGFAGDVVYVGLAEHAATRPIAATDLSARVVVVLGPLGAHAAALVPAWIEAGVQGVVLAIPDPDQFALYARSRGPSRYVIDAPVDDPIWQPEIPVAVVGPAVVEALIAAVRLPAEAVEGRPAAPIQLGGSVRAEIMTRGEPIAAANVAGVLPGADPAHRDRFILYTAHYDHFGVGEPDATGDSIYNGFSDNAAGVAMLLAIAEAMRTEPPPTSVLFLFFTAEERGLLGSTYYVTQPLVPLERSVAVINLDAGAPPAPPSSWRIAGDSANLGDLAREVGARHGWTVQLSAATPNSDYWPFATRDVPAIFIVPGSDWEGVGPDEHARLRQRWEHYHEPSDEWSADFPLSGLKRYARFALEVGRAAARDRSR